MANVFFSTKFGKIFHGNSLELLNEINANTVDLIMTSPPFGLVRKKITEMLMLLTILTGSEILDSFSRKS